MADVAKLVQEMKDYLAADHSTEDEGIVEMGEYAQLREMADAYAAACRDINDRAYRCQELLREAQWAQATQLAKQFPDLRTAAKVIDFSERAVWLDLCEEYQLPFPDIIDTEVVESVVEEVYGDKRTVQDLLRRHRRMAMGRAPLADRLRVLRKLCRVDSGTEGWKEDLQTYESERIEELLRQAGHAGRTGDLDVLEAIQRELDSDQWMRAPDRRVVEAVQHVLVPHRRQRAAREYADIVGELRAAHAAMDETHCRALMSRWYQVRSSHGYGPAEDLSENIRPVERWLGEMKETREEQEAYDRSCGALEQGIDEKVGRDVLEKCRADVLRFERGIPNALASRLAARIEELSRSARRRFVLTVVGVFVAVVAVGAGVTIGVIRYNRNQELSRWVDKISTALVAEDVQTAGQLLETLQKQNPDLYADPEVQPLVAKRDKIIQVEARRIKDLRECMQAVEKAGLVAPDGASLGRAEALAKSLPEKAQVQLWRERIREHQTAAVLKQRQEVERKMAELETAYAEVMAARAAGLDALSVASQKWQALAATVATMDGVSAQDKQRIDALRKASKDLVDKAYEKAGRDRQMEWDLSQLASRVDDPSDLAVGLEGFSRKYSEHPLAAEFTRAAMAVNHWKAAAEWRRLVATRWNGRLRVVTRKEVVDRTQQIRDYLQAHAAGPHGATGRKVAEYLAVADDVLQDDGIKNLQDIRQSIQRNPVLLSSSLVIAPDGKRYFCPLGAQPTSQKSDDRITGYSIEYYSDTEGTTAKAGIFTKGEQLLIREAPHTIFASRAVKAISGFRGEWETLYLELAEMAAEQPDIDPVVAVLMERRFLRQAVSCMPVLKDKVQKLVAEVNDLGLDKVNWVNPNGTVAETARQRAKLSLIECERIRSLVREVQKEMKSLEKEGLPYRPAGILLGSPRSVKLNGEWSSGDLYVVSERDTKVSRFLKIGVVKNGKAVMDAQGAADREPSGTLVFFRGIGLSEPPK